MTRDEWIDLNPLRKWRDKKSLVQGDVSAAMGITTQTVKLWERGETRPSEDHMTKLGEVTGIKTLGKVWAKWFDQGELITL